MDIIDQLTKNGTDRPTGSLVRGQMEKLFDVTTQTHGIANGQSRKGTPHIPPLIEIVRIAGEYIDECTSTSDRQPKVFLEIVEVERFQ